MNHAGAGPDLPLRILLVGERKSGKTTCHCERGRACTLGIVC